MLSVDPTSDTVHKLPVVVLPLLIPLVLRFGGRIVRLGLLGGSSVLEGTLRDVHNVENQWLKQVSDLKRV